MTKPIIVEDLRGIGMTAKVTDRGKAFITYKKFAEEAGHPSATVVGDADAKRDSLFAKQHETFKVLARGNHEGPGYPHVIIYVIESEDGEKFLVGDDGLDITETATSLMEQMAELEKATAHVDELHRAIRRKMYAEGFEEGRKAGREEAEKEASASNETESPRLKTRQQIRDEIVERAKKDVDELTKYDRETHRGDKGIKYGLSVVREEFVINKEKRTVVCLLKGASKMTVYTRGIAKCAPGDCFNVHIGKAIALRRALGLEVPDEYLNAPQPTEVREGDIVFRKGKITCGERTIIEEFIKDPSGNKSFATKEGIGVTCERNIDRIIDDSREDE